MGSIVRPIAPGGNVDRYFTHDQSIASAFWSIAHNLGKRPSVSVTDTTGRLVIGQVDYVDENHVTVTFVSPFSGKAYLN